MNNIFYVYEMIYNKRCLYIGKGCGNRFDHLLSCKSHNPYLNKFAAYGYDESLLSINLIEENLNESDAFKSEIEYIKSKNPLFNVKDNVTSIDGAVDMYLMEHFNSMVFKQLGRTYDGHPFFKKAR